MFAEYKVILIDEAHSLSRAAWDALLKTLEEPPSWCFFIFATTEPHRIPETIFTRSLRLDLTQLTSQDVIDQLRFIAGSEKITVSEEALELIAEYANGGMREAISTFEQLTIYKESIEASDVKDVFGVVGAAEVCEFTGYLTARDPILALRFVEELYSRGRNVPRFFLSLTRLFKCALLVKWAPKTATEFTPEVTKKIEYQTSSLEPEFIIEVCELIWEILGRYDRIEDKAMFAQMATLSLIRKFEAASPIRPPVDDASVKAKPLNPGLVDIQTFFQGQQHGSPSA
jgi:DNA polymerase-3 subunit gamma/tau